MIATAEHIHAIARQLREEGAYQMAVRERRLVLLDAEVTLASLMVDGQPDWGRFESIVGGAIEDIQARASRMGLRAYGEMVGLLWKTGRLSAAIRLEEFWNKLLESNAFSLFCAYPVDIFGKDFQTATIDPVLGAHTHLLPTRDDLETALNRAMDEVLGAEVATLRPLIESDLQSSRTVMPRAESIILWLRNHRDDHAEEILSSARRHCRAWGSGARLAGQNAC